MGGLSSVKKDAVICGLEWGLSVWGNELQGSLPPTHIHTEKLDQ
jgi:hypothetical protein